MRLNKLRILAGILEVCSDSGGNKTKIIYGSNINFKAADAYLDMLIEEGLMNVIGPGPREKYHTSEKGLRILGSIKEIYKFMECA
ncbi:Winged helix-turn-helix [uncultured archaeon]|nr:Winged helix-turn-helix [uncultured archaeon]